MNSKQAVEMSSADGLRRMREIEREIEKRNNEFIPVTSGDFWEDKVILKLEQETKEICEKFVGCGKFIKLSKNNDNGLICGEYYNGFSAKRRFLCPNCQEIKEIWERIKNG